MSDGSGSETYSYNAMGAFSSRSKSMTGVPSPYVTSYGYDDLGGLTSITYPSGRIVSQTYDAIGRLNQISSGGTNYLSSPTYNAAGQTLGFNYGNGLTAGFTYNDHLQLETLAYRNGTTDIFKLTYGYGTGNNGQIQSITDNVNGTAKSQAFTYDAWGRLRIAQTNNLTSANTWKLEWTYDRIGNRLSQTQTGGTASNIIQPQLTVSDTTNRITTSGYTYDAAGNMTNDSIHAYTYDAENRIKTLDGGGTYVYDGTGLRVKKGSTIYVWSGTKVIAEYSGTTLQTEYVYAGSQLLATLNTSGSPTYSHPDHLSTRMETDSIGTATRSFGHLPFGDAWYETGTSGKQLFTGYERDNGVGDSQLDYSVFRYYSPRLGRFMTADPLAGTIQSPQSLNRFAYVANDPINKIDPLGLMMVCFWDDSDGDGLRLLNCMYSSPAGGSGGEPKQGGNSAGKKKLPAAQQNALNDCIKAIFGVTTTSFQESTHQENGSFSGTTSDGKQINLNNDASRFSVAQLNTIHYGSASPKGKNDTWGLTLNGFEVTSYSWRFPTGGAVFDYRTSYTANDIPQILSQQVHELGHQLARDLGLVPLDAGEDVYGGKLEDCFQKKSLANQIASQKKGKRK